MTTEEKAKVIIEKDEAITTFGNEVKLKPTESKPMTEPNDEKTFLEEQLVPAATNSADKVLITQQQETIANLKRELELTKGENTGGKPIPAGTDNKENVLITEQQEKIKSLEKELTLTKAVNDEMSRQIEAGTITPPAAAAAEDTFQHDGKTIGFRFKKMHHNGMVITAAEVIASKDLQKELYESKSGMLKY